VPSLLEAIAAYGRGDDPVCTFHFPSCDAMSRITGDVTAPETKSSTLFTMSFISGAWITPSTKFSSSLITDVGIELITDEGMALITELVTDDGRELIKDERLEFAKDDWVGVASNPTSANAVAGISRFNMFVFPLSL
jgi:hypothetical protein